MNEYRLEMRGVCKSFPASRLWIMHSCACVPVRFML